MKSIKELIENKPSNALQAMLDGLREQSQRPDFKIKMDWFGGFEWEDKICFGCAATCAVQKLAGKNFTGSEIKTPLDRAVYLDFDYEELVRFEQAIDLVRMGGIIEIFNFCQIPEKESKFILTKMNRRKNIRFYLTSFTWQTQIPIIEKIVKILKKAGY